jgi:hypothetical protein
VPAGDSENLLPVEGASLLEINSSNIVLDAWKQAAPIASR